MLNEDLSNERMPSTTYAWRRVRVRSPAAGQEARVPKGRRWRHLSPWDKRRKLTITVRYRGGSEGWIQVDARGSMGRFPGHVQLIDVVLEVMNQER